MYAEYLQSIAVYLGMTEHEYWMNKDVQGWHSIWISTGKEGQGGNRGHADKHDDNDTILKQAEIIVCVSLVSKHFCTRWCLTLYLNNGKVSVQHHQRDVCVTRGQGAMLITTCLSDPRLLERRRRGRYKRPKERIEIVRISKGNTALCKELKKILDQGQ